ncbi:MAG: biopolymer transporter ExbB [Pseudomonadota bacterium]
MVNSQDKYTPFFSRPLRQIITMFLIVVLVGAGGYLLYPAVAPIFLASPYLNGFIFLVFLLGIWACFAQLFSLLSSIGWIEGFASERPGYEFMTPPRLLASLAAMMRNRQSMNLALNSASTQTILDSVATRLDERREITRYIINLLIFLGLLGTFYGLATTVPAVVDTIRTLAPQEGQSAMTVFDNLMTGLEAQLAGMGTAFGSSLLGLAGSLVVGLLDLFAGHGQNRFYREMEEWLSSLTSVGAGEEGGAGGVVDHIAEQSELMRAVLEQISSRQAEADDRVTQLSRAVEQMAQVIASEQSSGKQAVTLIGESQDRLVDVITNLTASGQGFLDDDTRARLRNMDSSLLQLLEELSSERQTDFEGLRKDIQNLTKTMKAKA